jgi:hypothetical protein
LTILGSDTDLKPDDVLYVLQQLKKRRFSPDSIETAVLIGNEAPVTLREYGQTLSCCLPAWNEVDRQVDFYLRDRRDVPALSFMEQNQKIRWPGYVFENYDSMPDTARVDTTSPAYRRLLLEKDSLRPVDSSMLRLRDSLAELPGARDSGIASPKAKADTGGARARTGADTLKPGTGVKPKTPKKAKTKAAPAATPKPATRDKTK